MKKLGVLGALVYLAVSGLPGQSSYTLTSTANLPCVSAPDPGYAALCVSTGICNSGSFLTSSVAYAFMIMYASCPNGASTTNAATIASLATSAGMYGAGVSNLADTPHSRVGTATGVLTCGPGSSLLLPSYNWDYSQCNKTHGNTLGGDEDDDCSDESACSEEGFCDNGNVCGGGYSATCECNDGSYDQTCCGGGDGQSCECGDGTNDPMCCGEEQCSYCEANYESDPNCNGGQYSPYCPDDEEAY